MNDYDELLALRERARAPLVESADPVAQVADRLARIPQGPWTLEEREPGSFTLFSGRGNGRHGLNLGEIRDLDWNGANLCAFLLHAPDDMRLLLKEIAALRQEVVTLTSLVGVSKVEQALRVRLGGD